jgi:Domain of unknown function (DUF4349)
MTTTHLRRLAAVPLLVVVLTLAACSGGSDSGDGGSTGGEVAAEAEDAGPAADSAEAGQADSSVRSASLVDEAITPARKAVIAKGVVSLLGVDAGKVRFDVGKIVDVHEGEVAEEKTQTDDEGGVTRSRLVVRVPVGDFDATMSELEGVAQLVSSNRNTEDVTSEVIDTDVRIRAQSQSLQRVEVLLSRAESLRDIVAIEAQLTQRQAELDSLKARQAYLADQTSMSTITVYIERKAEADSEKAEEHSGFLAGLANGWGGMTSFLTGLATLVGLLLPFAVLVLVLGIPTWLLVRSQLRRRPPGASAGQIG